MKKVAFLTTIFPMPKQYLIEFFGSLTKQTNQHFDLVIVNDGYESLDTLSEHFASLNIVELQYSSSPAENRQYGIDYVKRTGYEILIFGDSDDYFAPNRVQVCLNKLKDFDIVVNDLNLFNEAGVYKEKYFSKRIVDDSQIVLKDVIDKNIFGMTNTAINVQILHDVNFDKSIIAVDWYLFSGLLLEGYKALFTNQTQTFYRQHQDNTVGIGMLDYESFVKAVAVKVEHYSLMRKKSPLYEPFLSEIYAIQEQVKEKSFFEKLQKSRVQNPFWWEEVKDVEK